MGADLDDVVAVEILDKGNHVVLQGADDGADELARLGVFDKALHGARPVHVCTRSTRGPAGKREEGRRGRVSEGCGQRHLCYLRPATAKARRKGYLPWPSPRTPTQCYSIQGVVHRFLARPSTSIRPRASYPPPPLPRGNSRIAVKAQDAHAANCK